MNGGPLPGEATATHPMPPHMDASGGAPRDECPASAQGPPHPKEPDSDSAANRAGASVAAASEELQGNHITSTSMVATHDGSDFAEDSPPDSPVRLTLPPVHQRAAQRSGAASAPFKAGASTATASLLPSGLPLSPAAAQSGVAVAGAAASPPQNRPDKSQQTSIAFLPLTQASVSMACGPSSCSPADSPTPLRAEAPAAPLPQGRQVNPALTRPGFHSDCAASGVTLAGAPGAGTESAGSQAMHGRPLSEAPPTLLPSANDAHPLRRPPSSSPAIPTAARSSIAAIVLSPASASAAVSSPLPCPPMESNPYGSPPGPAAATRRASQQPPPSASLEELVALLTLRRQQSLSSCARYSADMESHAAALQILARRQQSDPRDTAGTQATPPGNPPNRTPRRCFSSSRWHAAAQGAAVVANSGSLPSPPPAHWQQRSPQAYGHELSPPAYAAQAAAFPASSGTASTTTTATTGSSTTSSSSLILPANSRTLSRSRRHRSMRQRGTGTHSPRGSPEAHASGFSGEGMGMEPPLGVAADAGSSPLSATALLFQQYGLRAPVREGATAGTRGTGADKKQGGGEGEEQGLEGAMCRTQSWAALSLHNDDHHHHHDHQQQQQQQQPQVHLQRQELPFLRSSRSPLPSVSEGRMRRSAAPWQWQAAPLAPSAAGSPLGLGAGPSPAGQEAGAVRGRATVSETASEETLPVALAGGQEEGLPAWGDLGGGSSGGALLQGSSEWASGKGGAAEDGCTPQWRELPLRAAPLVSHSAEMPPPARRSRSQKQGGGRAPRAQAVLTRANSDRRERHTGEKALPLPSYYL